MVNALKKIISPLPAGKCCKLTKQSRRQHHQAIEGKSSWDGVRVQALGEMRSLRSKTKLSAENCREMHFIHKKVKGKWIVDNVGGETAGA